MKKTHTTTTYVMTYVRLILLIAVSLALVGFVPLYSDDRAVQDFLFNQVVNMGILYAILVGFLTSVTLARKQSLDEYIQLELNKIRRMYHLGLHLVKVEPRLGPWFEGMRAKISAYQAFFCDGLFSNYEEGNSTFRALTYAIYDLPSYRLPYNSELYQYLLDATGEATEARQYIRAKKNNSIGRFQWAVVIAITLTLSAILVASTPSDTASRLVTAAVVFNMFIVLDLIYEYDHFNRSKEHLIAALYAQNLPEVGDCDPEGYLGKRRKKDSRR